MLKDVETQSQLVSNGYIEFGRSDKLDRVSYLKERFTKHLISPGILRFVNLT
jgi:hypothetical protein